MSDHRDEDLAEPFLDLDTKKFPYYRIWASSKPLLDSTPKPAKGTVGYHVHAWESEAAWRAGQASINQTFATVNINGRPWGRSESGIAKLEAIEAGRADDHEF